MPLANEHAARQQDPGRYKDFRRENDKFGEGIHVIWGILEDGAVEIQSIHFDASKFTPEQAAEWLKEHDHKTEIEPAKVEAQAQPTAPIQLRNAISVGESKHFEMVAYSGGSMLFEGYDAPVVVDLAGLTIPVQERPVRFNHSAETGLGHTTAIVNDGKKLLARGLLSRDTPAVTEVVESARRGFPWQASIGIMIEQIQRVTAQSKIMVNGQQFAGPLYLVTKSSLGEISIVDSGADTQTVVRIAAAAAIQSGVPTMAVEPNAFQVELDELKRKDAIEQLGCGYLKTARGQAQLEAVQKVVHDALEGGWNAMKAELEMLRTLRPTVLVTTAAQAPVPAAVLECAALRSARFPDVEKLYNEQTINAAQHRFPHLGLTELLYEAARVHGYSGSIRDHKSILQAAFTRLEAGFSQIDIAGILSNVANKFLLQGFNSVEMTWRRICATRNVPDFKTVRSYRLVGNEIYQEVPPQGEIKPGTLGEEAFTNRARTYGLRFQVDRQDLVNDDLGAITTIPRKLGRGSGLKINDIFWGEFCDNSGAFFSNAHANLIEAGSDLNIDSLSAAEQLFMLQTDSEGNPLGLSPAILLVPPALLGMGSAIFNSTELRRPTDDPAYPTANPHKGKYRVECSTYLQNANYGNSATHWFLMADPNDLAMIETCFLNGQESPTIETAEADFSVLGIQMRGYHDFGVTKQDERAAVKATGEPAAE